MIHSSFEHPVGALLVHLGGHSLLKGNEMYTMQPDLGFTIDRVIALYLFCGSAGTMLSLVLSCVLHWTKAKFYKIAVLISLVISVFVSISLYNLVPPKNEQVKAELMDEQWTQPEKSGKHTYRDQSYLMYMTPDGPVSFRRSTGQVYPKNAILYKN